MSQNPLSQSPLPPQPTQSGPDLSKSDLIPLLSGRVRLWRSRALIPIAAVTVTSLLLFGWKVQNVHDILKYMYVLTTFVLLMTFVALYVYSGERKNILWYSVPAAITAAQLHYFLGQYIYVFREVLPGKTDTTGFVPTFIGMFFAAGLMEEVLKAVPILLALALALYLRSTGSRGNALTRGLALQGPLDGVLMGAAAGAAFIWIETLLQYVPRQIVQANDPKLGVIMGFLLLFPRIIKGIVGHMGYAGILGYFIGLSVTHPKAAWKLIPIGIVLASLLHAFWNSASELSRDYGSYLAAPLIAIVFLACLMKARQLEASRLGRPVDGQSILAVSPSYGPAPIMPAGIVPPSPPGIAGALAGAATLIERAAGVTSRTTAASPPAPMPASGLAIGTSSARYALAAGVPIDLSALFGPDGVPAGHTGLILPAPGGLAIRNMGAASWSAATPDGAAWTVSPGEDLPAVAGTTLLIGAATIGIGAY
ncbi:PrsW family intramembrane metalloprotease [Enterovirga rhinocerotis]|uniref:RsiW-degrading membrane proteinase PrsW (M82 family) n=1 Tax=Enterovirga rhinocerotis TaxID=1339210 RepID=A0A4R7C7L1_9HYPH|nr:PrsW family glutamic-type intramembrane protease [Enterovirga rhinocerotis]TDR93962.1 RsiW-degrading membrane proteinase PrsW (M82 family) [Enterovirga rhinocerotis]